MDFLLSEIYNTGNVTMLASRIKTVYPEFNADRFIYEITAQLDSLNFGDRSNLIRNKLTDGLPNDFEKSCRILIDCLWDELKVEPGKTDWDGFIIIPMSEYIAEHGLDHFELSMEALYEMTKRSSSENAIRAFIRNYPDKTLNRLDTWTSDPNVHVRRLVSEGSRPRLPLCSPIREFIKDPKPVLKLLEKLKDDEELYVRRSVANNLNDISKDNPKVVVNTLKKWKTGASKERMWIISHALRTLLKKGDREALALLGYTKPEIIIKDFTCDNSVNIGGRLEFNFTLESLSSQNLMIDYGVSYLKANGKLREKVFKLSKKKYKKESKGTIHSKHSFKEMTTRKHYPGKHIIQLIVNGERFAKLEFMVKQK